MSDHSSLSDKQADLVALSEAESKKILSRYGVPVVEEIEAADESGAVAAARELGFPVVLKGVGARLLHKTEAGAVALGLRDEEAVRAACQAMVGRSGDLLESFLVQRQIIGKREMVAGLFRDRVFGPVVMFGLGGIFTEALSDVSFRVAPLTEADAGEMIDEIRAGRMLGEFRGEAAV
ncbi:MAG: acetate--CoA ligase family protein, partial [Desulfosudaceae bacterium]